ncbi:hypothetical protein CCO03_18775 [Comamonas serinivorans]|uniref:Peptidase M48 domain-containing protein n=2 Tax=Comamonas serinivorans TaxID=1082851 RepID=A0A1Y0EU99_9BURK|nr:hypothetical protein CCO03_18775 [Comamonas serinivorans]
MLALTLAALLLVPAPGWAQSTPARAPNLPSLGDAGAMTLAEERDLGDRIARELYRDPSAVDDPVLGDYIDQIWQRLLTAARQRGELPPELDARMAWRVVQIRDRAVNAFALPGGYLGLQYGLIAATQDRDELATVMGHEMSHVSQRHIARSIDQQSRVSPLMLAAMVVGAIAASKSPAAGQALIVGGQAAAIQNSLNFSRDMEREADRIGYAVMTQAGFAPDGAVRMFERLQTASRLNDSGAWPYLRTHPLTTERIGDMQSRQALRGKPVTVRDDLEHLLLAARARVLAETGIDELRTWARAPQDTGFAQQPLIRRAPALYQAAMAQAALRDWTGARATAQRLAELLQARPGEARPGEARPDAALPAAAQSVAAQARLLQADLAWRAGDARAVLELLPAPAPRQVSSSLSAADVLGADVVAGEPSRRPAPPVAAPHDALNSRATLLWRAMALHATGQAAAASGLLQSWVASHPDDALAWQTLAQAWQAQGNRLRALRAQAEARIAEADWQGARDRLQAARDLSRQRTHSSPGDHIEASIIDTRYQLASEKVRQQAEADARQR